MPNVRITVYLDEDDLALLKRKAKALGETWREVLHGCVVEGIEDLRVLQVDEEED